MEVLAMTASFHGVDSLQNWLVTLCYHYQSFVGRDFKAFMQLAIFIVPNFLRERKSDITCWYFLAKVNICNDLLILYSVCSL